MDENKDLLIETASESSISAIPSMSLGSLQADLTESCGINENFMLINDTSLGVRPCVELNYSKHVIKMNSKLRLLYQGRLYGKIEITGRKPMHILQEGSESWRAFKNELRFIASYSYHWHSHPNIIRYHGLFLKEEEGAGCKPYLLSEHVEWNLLSLLEDRDVKLSHPFRVSIVHDIASRLSFLHSRTPRAIVHAALDSSSVLIDKRRNAKLTNFFHAGYVGDLFTVVSESHKPHKYNAEMNLETSLDMSSLGLIINAIDTEHKNRECVRGPRNILEKFYVLYNSDDGPPQELTASEVCRQLAAYLEEGQPLSVSLCKLVPTVATHFILIVQSILLNSYDSTIV